ncbi:MAG TPA: thiamine pyrophosphate-dependent enzyme [Acidimicrobiia bacterium]|jgi:thiamine pyrophosphate-dependent acetolactate synthase large subunit-like protein/nitrite reductase/ring-hydroxylating ferredoxin subunit|nr:thiamine pyrophosphate-dependent enzyme [Acidimicrobiia bacterium]
MTEAAVRSWHRVASLDELDEGRVKTIQVGRRTLVLTHYQGKYGCLDNTCPHQGGPLGEGSIEKGWLRCPWHGYDYSPLDGTPPEGFFDAVGCFPTEIRDDGIYAQVPDDIPRERTVSDVMVETMINWGVDTVFGMVGHSNLGLAEAMRAAEERGDLRYFGIRHEGAASFAATAYGKLTGRLAACFAIAGPGSTNLLTGLYDAKMDRAPVLALSGQVPSKVRGRGAFQDADLSAAFKDVARYSQVVQAGSDHAELMNLACKTALVERDVSHLVFPDEVQVLPDSDSAPGRPAGRTGSRRVSPDESVLAQAVDLIKSSARPMIIVGNGARHDMDSITSLAESFNIPIATTFKAKGLVADDHPLGCGVLGRSGTPIASWFMNESDLLIAFGASFSNHTGIADYKPIIQVDFDPMALGRFHSVDIPLLADVGVAAQALQAALPRDSTHNDRRPEVAERWKIWREEKARRFHDYDEMGLSSARSFAILSECVPADAVICVDVGNNAYSFGRYFEVKNQTVLMSGYLGSIGFAFPAAMGAWAAAGSERPIVSVSGDGGFGQYAMELTTAVKYEMNITHVLLNNSELAKISKEQRTARYDVWQTSLHNPDFAAFAELCGAKGFRVTEPDELIPAVEAGLAHPGPSLVGIISDPRLV